MLAVLCAPTVATAFAPLLVYRWGRMAFYPVALVPLGSLVWVALNWPAPGRAPTVNVPWIPVLAIGALVLFYCADYFHHHSGRRNGRTENRLPSFAAEHEFAENGETRGNGQN